MKYVIVVIILALALSTIDHEPVTGNVIAQQETLIGVIDEQRKEKKAETKEVEKKPEAKPVPIVHPTYVAPPIPAGNWVDRCYTWAEQGGVALNSAGITLIGRESKCDPNAQNPSSMAYGIGQFLNSTWASYGCVKSADPVYQLQCMKKYVDGRYGGWQQALNFSYTNNWY